MMMMSILCITVLIALAIPSVQAQALGSTPVFVEDLKDKLQRVGIFENTPRGTVLGTIKCIDKDNDPMRYLVSNSATLKVDLYTGVVTLNRKLDREKSYNNKDDGEIGVPNTVRFICYDVPQDGSSPASNLVDLDVTVLDNNDEPPMFVTTVKGYTFYIKENALIGTILNGTISIQDADIGTHAKLSRLYLDCNGTQQIACDTFSVTYNRNLATKKEGQYVARIHLDQQLDYETITSYNPKLVAVDGFGDNFHLTSSIGLTININDSQDTNPVILNPTTTFDIVEGNPVGTFVGINITARDGDADVKRPVVIEILTGAFPDLFRVGPTYLQGSLIDGVYAARLIVNYPIDRDGNLTSVYLFTAQATELKNGQKTNASTRTVFTCNILDLNDNAPYFSQPEYRVSVAEMTNSTLVVRVPHLRIEVNDPDQRSNSQYRVQISSQTFLDAFLITPSGIVSGVAIFGLTVNRFQYMDYDVPANRNQTIYLNAIENLPGGGTRVSPSSAVVYLTLRDINDNYPIFTSSLYIASVRENIANFTVILNVMASDRDSVSHGVITYSLQQSVRDMFYISPTGGTIYLIGTLDYENVTGYGFTVTATDNSATPKFSQALVQLTITDFNDVGPSFFQGQYTGRVTESSFLFESQVRVEAEDPVNPNAVITYRIISGNTPTNSFVLNPTTGILSLRELVNYSQTINQTGIFVLVVEASDNEVNPQTVTTQIIVTVIDENNFPPVFFPQTYTATVREDVAQGTSLLTVYATDRDSGTNGKITYRIGSGGRDNIVVSPDGKVSVSNFPNFDFDNFQLLTVDILAVDGGSPQQSATGTVYITITNTNNKNPIFDRNFYTADVDEVSPVGTTVLTVRATDPDKDLATIRYSIDPNSITAINRAGSQLGSIIPYNYKEAFVVDPVSGIIRIGGVLDRTYVVEMSFDVVATDVSPSAIGLQTGKSRVLITIQGKPETDLYFNQPWTKVNPQYELNILESLPVGRKIMTIQARDPLDSKVVQTYQEVAGSDIGDYFQLIKQPGTQGGVLLLNRPLDYETGELRHSVIIRAIQPATAQFASRSVTATVVVVIQDANDNKPQFTRAVYRFTVPENVPKNFQVGVITAKDIDSASFGPTQFFLGGGLDTDYFFLFGSGNDGVVQLLVKKDIDFERRQIYNFEIIARDGGSGGDSTALIEITVVNINDNRPQFSDLARAFSVPETAKLRTVIGRILAYDNDTDLNAISYSLRADTGPSSGALALQLFQITMYEGWLSTRQILIGLSGTYKMLVVANDGGVPSLSAVIPVTIKVQGAEDDDGTPYFTVPINNYVVRVEEKNHTMLDVQFNAKARTPNATVIYSLAAFSTYYTLFKIDPITGIVSVIGDLDYEVKKRYTLVVQATDSIDPSLISRRTLIVELIDIDDNPPSFRASIYAACPNNFAVPTTYQSPDNTPAGTIVGQASACDPDDPPNNEVVYYLYTGNDICLRNNFGDFAVHLNGSIEALHMLDYEVRTEYLICVEVQRAISRRKRAFNVKEMVNTSMIAYVVIAINDINDNGPVFPVDLKTTVLGVLPTENTVIQVTAVDPDGPLNNRVFYTISEIMYRPPSGQPPISIRAAFSINPNSGVIVTNLPSYENFARGYFLITVRAFDVLNQLLNDTMTVKVLIYSKSQLLRVVLNKTPAQGIELASDLISKLNTAGLPDLHFYFKSASEHNTASGIISSQTDICFALVKQNTVYETYDAMAILDMNKFQTILTSSNYSVTSQGTCYPHQSSRDNLKWRDLWWVLVIIGVFIFVCVLILLVTICILYDRHKSYMDTQTTYLVQQ